MQYYMSRTKTGMDNMVIHAQEQLTGTAERLEQIEYNTYLTDKLTENVSTRLKTEKTDTMIREMEASLNQIALDIQEVDSAYLSTKGRNFIGFSDDSMGFAAKAGLLPSFLYAALILMAAFVCVFLRMFISDKEEDV